MSAASPEIALDPLEVYRVRSDGDPTVLLGLDARLRDDGVLTWFDTCRDRGFPVTGQRAEGATLVFDTERGAYRFEPLTLEVYQLEVKPLVELSPEFESTEALKQFYLQRFLGIGAEDGGHAEDDAEAEAAADDDDDNADDDDDDELSDDDDEASSDDDEDEDDEDEDEDLSDDEVEEDEP
ncbi:MAG: hypothetical protein IT384_24625 [Deltaproteobacteria bacterium]|nr:hypothetical protein [Deltaproteobacteria bacterium]